MFRHRQTWLIAIVALATGVIACSSAGAPQSTITAGTPQSTTSADGGQSATSTGGGHATITPPSGGSSGTFCADIKRLSIAASTIARSLNKPSQLRDLIDADIALETTAAAEAPAAIRADVLAASHAHQYQALAKAGYDFTKVNPADLEITPLQKSALSRVIAYVSAHCGFDPTTLVSGAP